MARKPVNVSPVPTPGGRNSRLDAFVDAAFAFAVTLLVISAERIPDSVESLLLALKTVPAFAASFVMVAVFWYAHVRWSRRYPLETVPAVLMSLLLVFLVLIYVYPLRLLFGTFFAWITHGWLPVPLRDFSYRDDVVLMFVVYGIAFASMSACMAGLYAHAWKRRRFLQLSSADAADAAGEVASYVFFVLAGLGSALTAWALPDKPDAWQLAIPGFLYFLLGLTGWVDARGRRWGLQRLHASKGKG